MAIDPSIALGFRPVEQPSQMNMLAQALQLQGLQRQNQLGMLDMKEREAAAAERNALRDYLNSGANLDAPEGQAGLYKVAPTQAAAILKGRLDLRKTQVEIDKDNAQAGKYKAETDAAAFKLKQDKVAQNLQGLAGVSTPEQAAQWISGGVNSGLIDMKQASQALAEMQQAAQTPQGFAQWKQNQQAAGLTIVQQMEQQWKAQNFQLEQKKAEEAARHNKATEGIGYGNLKVSQGRLELDKAAPKGVLDPERGLLVDPRSGEARPITVNGQPVGAKEKPLTDSQAKALLFGTRAQESDKILASIGDNYSPAAISSKQAAGKVPLVGGALEAGANALLSDDNQKVEQAQRDFINAVLRRESGAVISPSEFDNAAKQYFPQPNDGPAVRAQKARDRRIAIQGLLAEVPNGQRGQIPAAAPAEVAPSGFKIISVK